MNLSGHHHVPAALIASSLSPVLMVTEALLVLGTFLADTKNFTQPGFDPRTVHPVASH